MVYKYKLIKLCVKSFKFSINLLNKLNDFILFIVFSFILASISSYILLQKNTTRFDEQLFLKANTCLTNAQTIGANLEPEAQRLIDLWHDKFPSTLIRLYYLQNFLAGYKTDFEQNIDFFEFNSGNNAQFFYTEINQTGYRGIRIQIPRLAPQHDFGNMISIEMVENFSERASNAIVILFCIWLPFIFLIILTYVLLKKRKYTYIKNIDLAFNYLKQYANNMEYNILYKSPNISEFLPIFNISQELHQQYLATIQKQHTFIADASHQLRTPLTIIQLQLQQLQNNYNLPQVEILKQSVDRMIHLTKQLLCLTKFEYHEKKLKRVLWHDLIFNIASKWIGLAHEYNIDFGFEDHMGSSAYDVYINADIFMLEEAINNLLDNAIKYSKDSENPRITIIVGYTLGTVWVKIIDNGLGINQHHRQNLFTRFFRADNKNSIGAGLGLAIVKEIIQAHNGFIRLLEEKETVFLAVLPRAK